MKKLIIVSSKIVLSLVQTPLWFIKLFHGVGHMPNVDTGKIEEVHFYHTMYENISDLGCSFLFIISMVLVVFSMVLAILTLNKNNKKASLVSNVISIISVVLFVVLLIMASTVARGY